MLNVLSGVWKWSVEPVPLVIALAIYYIPTIYRRRKRLMYTPLYFLVYPLARLNIDFGKYLGDSPFAEFIENDDEAEALRKTILVTASVSTLLDTVVWPAIVAFIWAFFLTSEQFVIAVVVLLLAWAYQFIRSTLTFHYYTFGTPPRRRFLSVFYTVVLGVIAVTMIRVYQWSVPQIASGSYGQLIGNLADLFWSVTVSGVLVVLVVTALVNMLLDRKIRQRTNNARRPTATFEENTSKPTVHTPPGSRNQG